MFGNKKAQDIVTEKAQMLDAKLAELDLKIKQAACEHEFKPKMVKKHLNHGLSFAWATVTVKECIHCELQKGITELEYKKLAYDIAKKELNECYKQYYAGANAMPLYRV